MPGGDRRLSGGVKAVWAIVLIAFALFGVLRTGQQVRTSVDAYFCDVAAGQLNEQERVGLKAEVLA